MADTDQHEEEVERWVNDRPSWEEMSEAERTDLFARVRVSLEADPVFLADRQKTVDELGRDGDRRLGAAVAAWELEQGIKPALH